MEARNIGNIMETLGDCTDPGHKARALGCLRRLSFLRTKSLRASQESTPVCIFFRLARRRTP